ncbi:MAG TPA: NAD-dependent epimerase/dehydratase family protein [Chlamydiales bacterium]|nr:NAD-dependent epimerase/dehydratase family protein [Chlamydiales bacterium]
MDILIIGCGYIGADLANKLQQEGHGTTCTTTKKLNLEKINPVTRKALLLTSSDSELLKQLISENDVIILSIAPNINNRYDEDTLSMSQAILNIAQTTTHPKQCIFTSRTNVYGDHKGMWVDENSSLNPYNDQIQMIIDAEHAILSTTKNHWKSTILRIPFVYGPGRELSKELNLFENRPLLGKNFYTNMLHKEDLISVISFAINHNCEGIYNVCDDDHPTRKELLDEIIEKTHAKKIEVKDLPAIEGNARVSNHKIKERGFILKHPHRLIN